MRNIPYTNQELFKIIEENLKQNKCFPENIEYSLPAHDEQKIRTYEFDFTNNLDYGGNEGIYLNLGIRFKDEFKNWVHMPLGTIKTLETSHKAMRYMAVLLADFLVEAHDFVDRHLDDFTWDGYKVQPYKTDTEPEVWSWDCQTHEKALEKMQKELLSGKYYKVVVTEYGTRKTAEYFVEAS